MQQFSLNINTVWHLNDSCIIKHKAPVTCRRTARQLTPDWWALITQHGFSSSPCLTQALLGSSLSELWWNTACLSGASIKLPALIAVLSTGASLSLASPHGCVETVSLNDVTDLYSATQSSFSVFISRLLRQKLKTTAVTSHTHSRPSVPADNITAEFWLADEGWSVIAELWLAASDRQIKWVNCRTQLLWKSDFATSPNWRAVRSNHSSLSTAEHSWVRICIINIIIKCYSKYTS